MEVHVVPFVEAAVVVAAAVVVEAVVVAVAEATNPTSDSSSPALSPLS